MNSHFEALYGIKPASIQSLCVIMPFDIPGVTKELGLSAMTRGRVFACGQGAGFTLIRSGMSAGFVGDCTLYLEETPCRQILFLGTCGLIRHRDDLDIGSLVTPAIIHAFESFSAIVTNTLVLPKPLFADNTLTRTLPVPGVNVISFASLHEEEKHLALFDQLNAQVIEMECNAFFLACRQIHRPAGAILVIADILQEKTFASSFAAEDKKKLAEGIRQACQWIKKSL